MEDLALSVRSARPEDAADLARIYIESWQDTYAGVIAHSLLGSMSHKSHTARWIASIKGGGAVLVAEDSRIGIIGLCSLGAARDGGLGFEGEIYTLYVDPAFLGLGAGRALLAGAFESFKDRKLRSCLIDGEVVCCDERGLAVFQVLRQRRHEATAFLYALDLLELDGTDMRREPIEVRKTTLASFLRKARRGVSV